MGSKLGQGSMGESHLNSRFTTKVLLYMAFYILIGEINLAALHKTKEYFFI